MTKPLILLAAGGTGGHLFPAEACALELMEQGVKVVIATDRRGQGFSRLEKNKQVKIIRFSGGGVASGSLLKKVIGILGLIKGTFEAFFWMRKNRPHAAIGFGGFASVPALVAARFTGTPYMIHEQNAVLGRANRFLAKKAKLIATGFKKVKSIPPNNIQKWVGTPVRGTFLLKSERNYQATQHFHLLIMGGSQGAKIFSDLIPNAIKKLPEAIQERIIVTQQVRPEYMRLAEDSWRGSLAHYELAPFFSDIDKKMAAAHLYIGRAGASSLSECLAMALPAVMVPYPYAVDNHQYYNALNLSEQNCGWIISEEILTEDMLAESLAMAIYEPQKLQDVSNACSQMAKLDAAKQIAKLALGLTRYHT